MAATYSKRDQMLIGFTARYFKNGMSSVEIARRLGQPLDRINEWIELYKIAESRGLVLD